MTLTKEQQTAVTENHNLIYWYIKMKNLDITDWYDILAIELCYTIVKYNPEKGSLSNYFKMRADNVIRKEYSKSQLKKNKSIDHLTYNDEIFSNNNESNMEDIICIESLFDGENGDILKMRVNGYTQSEIADKLGVTQSYISKIIDKCRKEYYDSNG